MIGRPQITHDPHKDLGNKKEHKCLVEKFKRSSNYATISVNIFLNYGEF